MVDYGCGDDGGGKIFDETWINFEGSSPLLTFESLSDNFLGMFEYLFYFVLDLELGTTGAIALVYIGRKFEIGSCV